LAAQEKVTSRIFGYRIGLSLSDFIGDDSSVDDRILKPGFAVSSFYRLAASDQYSLQIEAWLVQKGAKWSGTDHVFGYPVDVEESINLLYLDIPVLLQVSLEIKPRRKISVFAGPYAEVAIHDSRKAKVSTEEVPAPLANELMRSFSGPVGNVRRLGLGMVGGFEVKWRLSNGNHVAIDFRYGLGLTNVSTDIGWDEGYSSDSYPLVRASGEAWDMKNGTFILSIGYGFPR
jgi:hypothetical protein